jgi:hypothetical protein
MVTNGEAAREQSRHTLYRVSHGWGRVTAGWRTLPSWLLIGAQKAGTTTLASLLVRHPDVAGGRRKEVDYFDLNYRRGLDWYRAHFPLRTLSPASVGEATTGYLFHPEAPQRVHELLPEARLIAILREPAARALSHYHQMRALGLEPLSFEEALDREPERVAQDLRARMFYSYRERGLYAEQLERWLVHFPRAQLLVVLTDELAADPAGVLRRCFEHIGVEQLELPDYPSRNVRVYAPMEPAPAELLRLFYRDPNERLGALLGHPAPWTS